MRVKNDKLQELEKLGFDKRTYDYKYKVEWNKYILVDVDNREVKLYYDDGYQEDIIIKNNIPQWAFIILVKMVQLDILEWENF